MQLAEEIVDGRQEVHPDVLELLVDLGDGRFFCATLWFGLGGQVGGVVASADEGDLGVVFEAVCGYWGGRE